jgi:hypothetical protein
MTKDSASVSALDLPVLTRISEGRPKQSQA